MPMDDPIWPLFGLRLSTPRLELRPVRDDDVPHLVEAALAGIHEASRSPFSFPWTSVPDAELPANTARHAWRTRAETGPGAWTLPFGVWCGSRMIGVQDVTARDIPRLRTVQTGSWLTRSAQGRGYGREMRAAVLLYSFDHLGAGAAESDAAAWNSASLGVSSSLGYRPNGSRRQLWGDTVQEVRFTAVTPETLVRPPWRLEVEGHAAAAAFLGLGPGDAAAER
ncbi:GNAT family protein [Zafaria sp. Z1313]|uniref:GNAT family N-acetyltransferase n=1 Tax=unclassified Zafaria TaxID=2828765 RepID=UPI002E796CE2|nr:GNAT family protein [Zafaria sp. J156]MEE1619931.1 GNAT family protein [Zafaria sp. J156]